MGKCLQCGNTLTPVPGKREKKFCNETCRSNYWYGKNKKRKTESPKLIVKNNTVKEKAKEVIKPKKYDFSKMPKGLNNFQQLIWKANAKKEQNG